MSGTRTFQFLQFAQEQTAGTAVTTSTALWRGKGTLEDARTLKFVDENLGYISQIDRTYVPAYLGKISFDSIEANFEQMPYLFAAGIKNTTSGSADTPGSDYVWTYPMATTAQQLPRTFTLQGGDDQQAEIMEYSYVDTIKLNGNAGEALMVSADWVGRQVANCTRTPATLSIPSVETILFSKGSLTIDAVTGTMGTTTVSQTLLSMDMSIKTGYQYVYTADGQIYFSFIKQIMPEVTMTLTYEHNSTATTEMTAWRNETPRQIQLKFLGTVPTTGGGTYATKTLLIQMAGKYESVSKISDTNGNDIRTFTFRARYDPTCAKYVNFVVVNEISALN